MSRRVPFITHVHSSIIFTFTRLLDAFFRVFYTDSPLITVNTIYEVIDTIPA